MLCLARLTITRNRTSNEIGRPGPLSEKHMISIKEEWRWFPCGLVLAVAISRISQSAVSKQAHLCSRMYVSRKLWLTLLPERSLSPREPHC